MTIILFDDDRYDWIKLKLISLTKPIEIISKRIDPSLLYQDDKLAKLILDLDRNKTNLAGFIIPASLGHIHTEYLGLKLGLLIRLAFEKENVSTRPIYFLSFESSTELIRNSHFSSILNCEEVYLCNYNLNDIQNKISISQNLSISKINSGLNKINLERPIETSRHSLSNDWAIYRLADIFGILEQIENNLSFNSTISTPYFRLQLNKLHYKKSIGVKKITSNLISCEKSNFLLIDDKASFGWAQILGFLLKKMNSENILDSIDEFKKNSLNEFNFDPILNQIETEQYDLIFLDLRLLEAENSLSLNELKEIEDFSGAKLLSKIKEKYPFLPIIMFTASQQAWNFSQILELGADGYFIKESPDNLFSDDLLINNTIVFSSEIATLTKKSKILSWFFLNSSTLKDKLDTLQWNIIVVQRIKDKLEIAFSILMGKRTKFEKKFFNTEYELAFLVYWSCLNEFQTEKIGYYNGRKENFTFNDGTVLLDNSTSKIEYVPTHTNVSLRRSPKWTSRFSSNRKMPNVNLLDAPKQLTTFEMRFFRDMSNLVPSYIYLKMSPESHHQVDEFLYLNEIRNRLDFTHSDKNIISKQSIISARNPEQALEDCKDMFKFIYFLITENELE